MTDRKRVFFALWPGDALRAQLAGAADSLSDCVQGKAVPAHNYHVTLRFLGAVTAHELECIREAAGKPRLPAFQFRLDSFGYWAGPRVAWLGARQAPDDLLRLVSGLNLELEVCGFPTETGRFRPHVTLYRDAEASGEPPLCAPLAWECSEFVLVESQPGRPYTVIDRWPLGAGD